MFAIFFPSLQILSKSAILRQSLGEMPVNSSFLKRGDSSQFGQISAPLPKTGQPQCLHLNILASFGF
jgi:hypothetical protein